jgi:hypothetical protein
MKDANGKELTHDELKKILRQNTHPQYNNWKAKAPPRWGDAKPPRGVRGNKPIKDL